jgi:NitT/TauT family transport system permease protein
VLALWQLAAVTGLARALPTPAQVGVAGLDLVVGGSGEAGRYSGAWLSHALPSATRVLAGFAAAAALAVPAGMAIGLSHRVERLFDPTIQVLRNIPITAFVPIAVAFLGFSDAPAVFLIALGAFFPTVVSTTHGVRQVSRLFVRTAAMMGASRWQLLSRVVFPAALPAIFTGLRLSLGVAWVLVVVSELLAVRSGLGYLLWDSYQFFRTDVMVATMVTIGLLGFASDRALTFARGRALAWNRFETLRG